MNKIVLHIIIYASIALCLTACELFVFGAKRPPIIEVSQKSSLGAVLLFKAELDSNNTIAATELLASKNGKILLAAEKYDMADDIARISRIIARKPITRLIADTITPNAHRVMLELDYLKKMTFSAARINNAWYITEIKE